MQIYFTPSAQQIADIASSEPKLYEKIRNEVLEQLTKRAITQSEQRLTARFNTAYEAAYKEVEKNHFTRSGWSNVEMTSQLKQKFSAQIDDALTEALQKEMASYLSSDSFQRDLRLKVKEQILSQALKSLDAQISEEAKKLTA